MMAIVEKRNFREFDWLLLTLAVSIVCFGIWQIYNAQPTEIYWQKQIIGLILALFLAILVAFIDYRVLVYYAPVFYVIGIILLILVLTPLGVKVKGQQAWLKLPLVGQFQPSEFVKIPVLLMFAKYFNERNKFSPLTIKETLVGVAIIALPVGLILLEPDAGQALTYMPLLAVVLFLSSIKIRYVILSIAACLILLPLGFYIGVKTGKIKQYQVERINVILDPESADPRGYGYHTLQSMITIGQGGITGIKGDTERSQSALKFLPEPHTDFIFAVTAENTGFVGCVSLLLAYALLISRLIMGARYAPDRASMLFIMAFVGGLTFQIFINVGMTMGMVPVIGVPLPLMSAGLSSILSTFIAIGFVLSVRMRRFVNY
ncbi:MAG: rod shape-determining protein RodA [Pyrinomonadaceae bacterium]|nr:rod shape-determining protein RodA [Pyrinomonadaceae bacterium]MCX7638872.1 rod shape-determining protein RodA [Pyrinomonadaceae bacterium]MDW8304992.1 FtsW/RodA/SpoVE family cell cycle protein [Acidobacteriota bacterium]